MINGRRASSTSPPHIPHVDEHYAFRDDDASAKTPTDRTLNAKGEKAAAFDLVLDHHGHVRSSVPHEGGNDGSISDRHRRLCREPLMPCTSGGRLRGQEGKGRFEKKKKKKKKRGGASEEVQHPVLNQECFLKKPAFPLSRLSHLWQVAKKKKNKKKRLDAQRKHYIT